MDRRTFLALSAIAGGMVHPGQMQIFDEASAEGLEYAPPEIFPKFEPPRHLQVAPLDDASLIDRQLYTSLQGLVNRKEPRVYYVTRDIDTSWLEYYRDSYHIDVTSYETAQELLKRYAEEISGYIVYDPENPDSRNVALLMGGLQNALPIHPSQAGIVESVGLKELDDLKGRWSDRYEAYRWALAELFPKGNQRVLGVNCVDEPHWPSQSFWLEDYLIAGNILTFDLSAARRDREDRKLLDEIYGAATAPGCIIGWRSARNVEHEMVGFAARRGFFTLCGLSVANITVHTAIPKPEKPFRQKHISKAEVGPVEKKIYVAFMNTDGDSLGSMLHFQSGRFLEPQHGLLPYSWGFLPLAYDLLPGIARRNWEMMKPNDYFVAATCGAAYTYPYLLPDTDSYLEYTRYYQQKMDLRVAYMSNWDDDFWWQEMEVPGFYESLCEHLPDSIGFGRGMGESPFEPSFFDGCAPYIFCGEGLHSDSDVHQTIVDFVAANTIRPLFIFLLTNHNTKLATIHDALDRLPNKSDYEFVRLDKFFHLLTKAREEGLIGDDLYPDKEGLRDMLAQEAKAGWEKLVSAVAEHGDRANLTKVEFTSQVTDPMTRLILDRSATPANDIVMWDVVWDSMKLTKSALNIKGVYVNEKAKGVRDFARVFGNLDDAVAINEIWKIWEDWEETRVPYEEACLYAKRLAGLVEALDNNLS